MKRFRLQSLGKPDSSEPLNEQYSYSIHADLDPGAPFAVESARVRVLFDDLDLRGIAEGSLSDPDCLKRATARTEHYVITQLQRVLATGPAQHFYTFSPMESEIEQLRRVDPSRVTTRDWIEVQAQPVPARQRVFISCGQQSVEELRLGGTIARLVKEHSGLEGYFAQYQQTPEGLTANIFRAIHQAAAFIAVMHRRDPIGASSTYRGSVWVEQEIAIAAFMVQTLGTGLQAKVYVQRGMRREGVRGFILLNPIDFETPEQILTDLTGWLATLKGSAVAP